MGKILLILSILVACATDAWALEDRPVGLVKSASGEAFILREGRHLVALPGSPLLRRDVLATGKEGSLGVILRDDTVLSMGPSSKVEIEQFAYEPHKGNLGMVLRVSRGIIEYLSGKISKLAPGSVRIETPVATLGIRGTRLLARIDG